VSYLGTSVSEDFTEKQGRIKGKTTQFPGNRYLMD